MIPEEYLCCVVPAAGASSRMKDNSGFPKWKVLLPWNNTTICGTVLDTIYKAGLSTTLIGGYCYKDLYNSFSARENIKVIENKQWQNGRTSTIQCAIKNIDSKYCGFLVINADMPRITVASIHTILNKVIETNSTNNKENQIVFAEKDGHLGHPVWLPSSIFPKILSLEANAKLRPFLLEHSWTSVTIDDDGIFFDIDTIQDYQNTSIDTEGKFL